MASVKKSVDNHLKRYDQISNIMLSKNGFYKRGEWEKLEKKRIYHAKCAEDIEARNRLLSFSEKKKIFRGIKVRNY